MGSSSSYRYIQALNLNGVQSLAEAQSRQWSRLGQLTESIEYATLQYHESKLYVISYYSGNNLQVFDINSGQTTRYSSVYSTSSSSGLAYAGSWISNGNMTIFGGFDSHNCYQQSGILSNPSVYWGNSCDNTIIEGTVISGYGQWVNYANIFK